MFLHCLQFLPYLIQTWSNLGLYAIRCSSQDIGTVAENRVQALRDRWTCFLHHCLHGSFVMNNGKEYSSNGVLFISLRVSGSNSSQLDMNNIILLGDVIM